MTFVLSSLFVIRIDVVEVWQVPEGKSLVGDDDRELSYIYKSLPDFDTKIVIDLLEGRGGGFSTMASRS